MSIPKLYWHVGLGSVDIHHRTGVNSFLMCFFFHGMIFIQSWIKIQSKNGFLSLMENGFP
jgi:hypothetical protein